MFKSGDYSKYKNLARVGFVVALIYIVILGFSCYKNSKNEREYRINHSANLYANAAFGTVLCCGELCSLEDQQKIFQASNLKNHIVTMIRSAKENIVIGTFNLSIKEIYDELVMAQEKGRKNYVAFSSRKLYFTDENTGITHSRINDCVENNISRIQDKFKSAKKRRQQLLKICDTTYFNYLVRAKLFLSGINDSEVIAVSGPLYHHKFVIVDNNQVAFGSGNLTPNGLGLNFEEWTFLSEPSGIKDNIIKGLLCEVDKIKNGLPDVCSNENILFTPYSENASGAEQQLNRIILAIEKAENKIDIFVHKIHNKQIIKALEDAAKRGVKIRLIRSAEIIRSDKNWLGENKPTADNPFDYVIRGDAFRQAHAKFAIFDDKNFLVGTGNWSNEGLGKNFEFFISLNDEKFKLDSLKKFFESVWVCDDMGAKSNEEL